MGQAPDFALEDHGSIWLLRPLDSAGRAWLEEHCPADDNHLYWAGALVVEPRYVPDLAAGIVADGLTVEA
jgi:hypothetical protein